MDNTHLVVFCTCPHEYANRLAHALIDNQVAACVNQITNMLSTYHWQNQIVTEAETLLLIKTTAAKFNPLAEIIQTIHPYEVPEIIALPISHGLPSYLQWMDQTLQGNNS